MVDTSNSYNFNMKILLLSALFAIFTTAICSATPYGQTDFFINQKKEETLAYKILENKEITYCAALPTDENIDKQQLQAHIAAALKEWTYGITLRINQAGRSEEFKDLTGVLSTAKFKYLSQCNLSEHKDFMQMYPQYLSYPETADITVILSTAYCRDFFNKRTPFYSFSFGDTKPFICLFGDEINISAGKTSPSAFTEEEKALVSSGANTVKKAAFMSYSQEDQEALWKTVRLSFYDEDRNPYFAVITHEIGHAFGLNDQYTAEGENPLYSSIYRGDNIMTHSYEPIGCDDIDSLITIMDTQSGSKRTFKSFCNPTVVIKNGIQVVQSETPKLFRQTQAGFELSSLTSASPETATYKQDIVAINAPLDNDMRARLSALGIKQSEMQNIKTVTLHLSGLMKHNGQKIGKWIADIEMADKNFSAYTIYNNKGAIEQTIRRTNAKEDIIKEINALKQKGVLLEKRISLRGF